MTKTTHDSTCVIISAPSGSGKTTYANRLLAERPEFMCVSPDDLRLELTGDMSDQSRNGFIFNTLLPCRINGVKSRFKGCIIDSTATTRKARRQLIEYAKTAGYTRIECHIVWAGFKLCVARNAARARQVPLEVLARQHAQWQEPELAEGFDEIVQIDPISLDRLSQLNEIIL